MEGKISRIKLEESNKVAQKLYWDSNICYTFYTHEGYVI